MKKLLSYTIVIAAMASTQAFAQAQNFEGFSVGANAEFDRSTVSGSSASDSGNSTSVGLQGQYHWALGSNFLLGLGLTANAGNRKAGLYASGADAYTKDRYAFDIMPSYAVSDKVLVYAKVSSVSANAVGSDSSTVATQGVGYGLGVRGLIDRNLYWQAGYDSVKFNDVTFSNGATNSLKSEVYSLGLGYKF